MKCVIEQVAFDVLLLPYPDRLKRWDENNKKLSALHNMKEYGNILIESWSNFKSIEQIVNATYLDQFSNLDSTLLHFAAKYNQIWLLEQLLKDPACDVSAKCSNGKTALEWAADANSSACINVLLSHPKQAAADPDQAPIKGRSSQLFDFLGGYHAMLGMFSSFAPTPSSSFPDSKDNIERSNISQTFFSPSSLSKKSQSLENNLLMKKLEDIEQKVDFLLETSSLRSVYTPV